MFGKEMMAALEADGEKLAALTGEDHGPVFDPAPLQDMPIYRWLGRLAVELAQVFSMSVDEGHDYIRQTGEECWIEMYAGGLSPAEAAREEASAAFDSQ